jgi:hypothetical protein
MQIWAQKAGGDFGECVTPDTERYITISCASSCQLKIPYYGFPADQITNPIISYYEKYLEKIESGSAVNTLSCNVDL